MIVKESSSQHFLNLFSAKLIATLAQFFSTILLIKWIGIVLFAQYSVTTASMAIISAFSSLGWENYFSIFLKRKDKCLESYLITAATIQAYQLLFAIFALSSIGYFYDYTGNSQYIFLVLTVAGKSFLESKQNYIKCLLATFSLGKPEKDAKFVSSIAQLLLILLFWGLKSSFYMILIALLAPMFIESLILILSIKNNLASDQKNLLPHLCTVYFFKNFAKAFSYFRVQFSTVTPFWFNNTLNSFSLNIDMIFCQYLGLPDKAIAAYSFARSGFSFLRLLPFTAYRTALARFDPKIYSLNTYMDKFKIKIYKMSGALLASCIFLPLLLLLSSFYITVIPEVVISAIPLFIILSTSLVGQMFLSISFLRLNLLQKNILFNVGLPVRSAILIVSLFLLGDSYGVQGVASSVSISVFIVGLGLFLCSENPNFKNFSTHDS